MKSYSIDGASAAAVFLVLLCGSSVAIANFNGNDKTVIDTLAWTPDLSEVNNRKYEQFRWNI